MCKKTEAVAPSMILRLLRTFLVAFQEARADINFWGEPNEKLITIGEQRPSFVRFPICYRVPGFHSWGKSSSQTTSQDVHMARANVGEISEDR